MENEAPIVRRGGWPKGRPRTTPKTREKMTAETMNASAAEYQMARMKARMKARPNWESDDFGVEKGEDRLAISREKIDALARDGVALQWVTRSVRGAEMRGEMSKMAAGGWTPVHASDFDGFLDGDFNEKGTDDVIAVDDCMLVARPMAIHEKTKRQEYRAAQEPLDTVQRTVKYGLPVSGGDDPTATSKNKARVYGMDRVDPIEIPD
jgi:hypothetical protein